MNVLNKDKEPQTGFMRSGSDDQVATTLGADTEFNGTLKFGKTLKIEGKFEGSLSSPGRLIVARTGEVKAEIKVGNITVEGKVDGNIITQELIELKGSAELNGDISAARLSMEDGVVFVGRAEIRPDSSKRGLSKPVISPKPQHEESQPEEKK